MAALLAAPHIAWLPAAPTAGMLHTILAIVRACSAWRMSEWRLPGPTLAGTLGCLAFLTLAVCAVRTRSRFALPVTAVALLAAIVCAVAPHTVSRRSGELEISAIDVGQGDSIFIVSPDGHTMLVDAGGPTGGSTRPGNGAGGGGGNFNIGERCRLALSLEPSRPSSRCRSRSPMLTAITWAACLPSCATFVRVSYGLVTIRPFPPTSNCSAKQHRLASTSVPFRRAIPCAFGGTTVRVLSPAPRYQPGGSATNDDSLVLHLSYAGHSALLEGDAEAPSEAAMLSLPPGDLASDLLKVGHHGSKTSTTPPFLARVAPHLAVISVGPFNSYHHPRWETLDKLENEGAHTWRTDMLGVSTFYIDGTGAHPDLPSIYPEHMQMARLFR